MKIHGIFLCLFGVGHKKLFLIQKDHLDLKDSASLVKNQKLNMFLSQKTPVQFPPLRSPSEAAGHSLSLMFYTALLTYLPKY